MKLSTDVLKTPTFIKITAIALLCFSIFFLTNHLYSNPYLSLSFLSSSHSSFPFNFTPTPATVTISPSPLPLPLVKRIGILDENGVMSENFEVGDFDPSLIDDVTNSSSVQVKVDDGGDGIRVERYKVCQDSFMDFIPCLDNVEEIKRLNSTERRENYERHCPSEEKALNCLVPRPKGYQIRMPWPQSRDKVWFSNVPRTRLVEDKGGQNWIARKKDKFTFPRGGGADKYLNQIVEMVPDIAFGQKTQVALDIGSGVASFGALLMQRKMTTLSIEPEDNPENRIQLALERGMPAMVAALDGILLLEVNRLLRAGGYFVWAAQPVYKNEEKLAEQGKEMEDLTTRMCWELVKKEGYIAIWQKPLNNSCYRNRDTGLKPSFCDENDDPDNVWYVGMKACITQLPENGYGANLTTLPLERQLEPPDRLQSIKIDAVISRKEIFKAETKYWIEILDGYIRAYHWKELNFRNIMDMIAGFGGFAAALRKFQYDFWVMNVVPVSRFNTLPVIYDRGLIGVMHNWYGKYHPVIFEGFD